jgi:hypothetical protein
LLIFLIGGVLLEVELLEGIWDRDETLKLEGTWMEDDEIQFPPTETNVGICSYNNKIVHGNLL